MDADRAAMAATLLAWYREMGVDAAVADTGTNWLSHGPSAPGDALRGALAGLAGPQAVHTAQPASSPPPAASRPTVGTSASTGAAQSRLPNEPKAPPPARAAGPPAQRPAFAPRAPDTAEQSARSLAISAQTIAALAETIAAFDGCGLKATASKACVWRGSERARLMIVGEAPGRDEDIEGRPFVGRAGQLLDRMLASIGLADEDVHITNIVYWRPPGNRTPTPLEAQVCRPFLERQVELVAPEVVLLLGGAAAKHVLDVADGIMRLRGAWREVSMGTRRVKALASLHPAYLLRTPAAKRLAWQDLLTIKAALAVR